MNAQESLIAFSASPNRQTVHLRGDDRAAAWQVLAWLAYPRRSDWAFETLEAWGEWQDRQTRTGRDRRPARLKPNRLEARLRSFGPRLTKTLQAGQWLKHKLAREAFANAPPQAIRVSVGHQSLEHFSVRGAVRALAQKSGQDADSLRRDYWRQKKNVIHLAAGTDAVFGRFVAPRYSLPTFLSEVAFNPSWVSDALREAEAIGAVAVRYGVRQPEELIRFVR